MQRSEHVIPDASTLPSWRKSRYSDNQGGDCVEVCDAYGPWHKSSYSGGSSGSCVEMGAADTARVPVRDSKDPHGPAVLFRSGAWSSFVTAVQGGLLDG